jgi:hypothetical protein
MTQLSESPIQQVSVGQWRQGSASLLEGFTKEGLCVFFFFETGFLCVAQAGLQLLILLPLPPKYRNYRQVPLCPAMRRLVT